MGPASIPTLCARAKIPMTEPMALFFRPSMTPAAIMAGNEIPPATPSAALTRKSSQNDFEPSMKTMAAIPRIPPVMVRVFLLKRSAQYPMGTWRMPATNTLIITTIPMALLESPSLVLAKRGRNAHVMPMHVVKQARKTKRENTEGILASFP